MTYNQCCHMYNYMHRCDVSNVVKQAEAAHGGQWKVHFTYITYQYISWVFTGNYAHVCYNYLLNTTVRHKLPLSSVIRLDLTVKAWKMVISKFVYSRYPCAFCHQRTKELCLKCHFHHRSHWHSLELPRKIICRFVIMEVYCTTITHLTFVHSIV